MVNLPASVKTMDVTSLIGVFLVFFHKLFILKDPAPYSIISASDTLWLKKSLGASLICCSLFKALIDYAQP